MASVQSPAGVLLAGKHGVSVISLSVPRDAVISTSLKDQWAIAEDTAAKNGQTVRREDWRLSVGCHLAETREQAFEDIRVGVGRVVTEYTGGTNGNPIPDVPANDVVDYMVEHTGGSRELRTIASLVSNAFRRPVAGSAGYYCGHRTGRLVENFIAATN